ncbi:hypothetical protein [Bradyrhizobium sp. Ai1a-2]|uniref:hypothetical protein n=1 Tax=Bradyrhizobium sp. Ai1a-2 TaxID=196490 RepID=UPI000480192E|nr:hypothetical protein [Bradyrhizobium sp. Ai1a-2]
MKAAPRSCHGPDCGADISGLKSNALFCSSTCRVRAHKAKLAPAGSDPGSLPVPNMAALADVLIRQGLLRYDQEDDIGAITAAVLRKVAADDLDLGDLTA